MNVGRITAKSGSPPSRSAHPIAVIQIEKFGQKTGIFSEAAPPWSQLEIFTWQVSRYPE